LQVQKTVKPKRQPVERRSPCGERRLEPPARKGSILRNRPVRTRMPGGVAGKRGRPRTLYPCAKPYVPFLKRAINSLNYGNTGVGQQTSMRAHEAEAHAGAASTGKGGRGICRELLRVRRRVRGLVSKRNRKRCG